MRSETDVFYQSENDLFSLWGDTIGIDESVEIQINVNDPFDTSTVTLTKQQAAKFARQLLEMCGEVE